MSRAELVRRLRAVDVHDSHDCWINAGLFEEAAATLEGDAQPVAYQQREKRVGEEIWSDWYPSSKDAFDEFHQSGSPPGKFIYEVRALVPAVATPPSPKLGVAVEDDLEQIKKDAERWNALLRCARIRMFGSAGFDPKTGERHEYNNATSQYEKSSEGWVHFGAEFWSVYPGHEDEDRASRWGTVALTALADDVLLKEKGEALSQLEKPGEARDV